MANGKNEKTRLLVDILQILLPFDICLLSFDFLDRIPSFRDMIYWILNQDATSRAMKLPMTSPNNTCPHTVVVQISITAEKRSKIDKDSKALVSISSPFRLTNLRAQLLASRRS